MISNRAVVTNAWAVPRVHPALRRASIERSISGSGTRRSTITNPGIVVFVMNFPFGAVLCFLPLYLQELLHYNPLQAGLLLLPASVTLGDAAPVADRLIDSVRRAVVAAGA